MLESPGKWLEKRQDECKKVRMWDAIDENLRLKDQGQSNALEDIVHDYEKESQDEREGDTLIGRQRGFDAILIHDGNGRLQVWAARLILGLPYRDSIPAWVGHEGERVPTSEDLGVLEEAKTVLFPVKAEVKLIERRFGADGMEYFAQRVGPYEGAFYWFVWRVPVAVTSGVGEIIGQVVNRAVSLDEAEWAARATLDRVVPVTPQKEA